MYDINKRTEMLSITVSELINELSKLPTDATVTCCGDDHIWLHIEDDDSSVCIDTCELDTIYHEYAEIFKNEKDGAVKNE